MNIDGLIRARQSDDNAGGVERIGKGSMVRMMMGRANKKRKGVGKELRAMINHFLHNCMKMSFQVLHDNAGTHGPSLICSEKNNFLIR